ncbi:Dps family protein [Lacibacter sediminis]|uniref:DNA starvation/stationary phase protection protein n=1 Tax=Lacibacter sediminis TaxID=2760713 RepID=A0A7G5XKB9_9BACT|nr:DNA starvation/stationary phase protection protein [Lacibacter sediminis]QNA45922.1 DNA starvation/stationary phase protection protein [Lacibacter sediminis]
MSVTIGIREENAASVAADLSKILADEFVLYTKTRNAHWNVTGDDFYAKHKFFEDQYEMLDEIMDEVAERIRSINHFAPATLRSYLQLTHLTELSREKNDSHGYIKELLADHDSIIMNLRIKINLFAAEYLDLGSSDFITGLMEKHEKMAWMLRAHLL